MPPKFFKHLQKSHFQLGGAVKPGISEYMAEYIPRKGDSEDVNAETVRNLRKSHFTLTGDAHHQLEKTTHQREFIPRTADKYGPSVDLHLQRDNIKFGNQPNDYKSEYTAEFIPRETSVAPCQLGLQRSHFKVGGDVKEYKTNHQVDFRPYGEKDFPEKQHFNYQVSHIKTAESNQSVYDTEYNRNFVPRDTTAHEVHDLTRFQGSHFKIGDDNVKYGVSTTHEALQQTVGVDARRKPAIDLHLQGDNIAVGKNLKFQGQSEMRAQYIPRDGAKPSEPIIPAYQDTQAHVCPLNNVPRVASETRSQFVPRDADFNDADARKIKEFMNHPTDPNCYKNQLDRSVGRTSYQTNYDPSRLTYDSKDAEVAYNRGRHKTNNIQMRYEVNLDKPQTTTQAALQESIRHEGKAQPAPIDNHLWRSHIITTSSKKGQYDTEYNTEYIPRSGGQRELNAERLADLRRSHYNLGSGQTEYVTEMQASIRPHDDYVDDNKYCGISYNYGLE